MLSRLFSRKKLETSIGIDLAHRKYRAVRLEFHEDGPRLTQSLEVDSVTELKKLESADRVVARPPIEAFLNRRVVRVEGNWSEEDHPSYSVRGKALSRKFQGFTGLSIDQVVYGWRVLSYDSSHDETNVELRVLDGAKCARSLKPLEDLKIGPVHLDAVHGTALDCVIPPKYRSYLLQTRAPDGFSLVRDRKLVAHIAPDVLTNPASHPLDAKTLKEFIQVYHKSRQPGLLQAYFLNPKATHIKGLSCSWVGDNCQELVDTRVPQEYLQALGLAMSSDKEWWLHHVSEFGG